MHAVALVVLYLGKRRIDRDLMKVGAAESRDLCIGVGMDTTGEQGIIGEVDARYDVRRTERDLLGFREEVIRVAVENHAPDGRKWHQFLRYQLGRVEHIKAEALGLFLGEYLQPSSHSGNSPDSMASHKSRR